MSCGEAVPPGQPGSQYVVSGAFQGSPTDTPAQSLPALPAPAAICDATARGNACPEGQEGLASALRWRLAPAVAECRGWHGASTLAPCRIWGTGFGLSHPVRASLSGGREQVRARWLPNLNHTGTARGSVVPAQGMSHRSEGGWACRTYPCGSRPLSALPFDADTRSEGGAIRTNAGWLLIISEPVTAQAYPRGVVGVNPTAPAAKMAHTPAAAIAPPIMSRDIALSPFDGKSLRNY